MPVSVCSVIAERWVFPGGCLSCEAFFATLVTAGQAVNEQQDATFHDPDSKTFQHQQESQFI